MTISNPSTTTISKAGMLHTASDININGILSNHCQRKKHTSGNSYSLQQQLTILESLSRSNSSLVTELEEIS